MIFDLEPVRPKSLSLSQSRAHAPVFHHQPTRRRLMAAIQLPATRTVVRDHWRWAPTASPPSSITLVYPAQVGIASSVPATWRAR